jgi:hypothetical protein
MSIFERSIIAVFILGSLIIGGLNLWQHKVRVLDLPDSREYISQSHQVFADINKENTFKISHFTYIMFLAGIFRLCGENLLIVYIIQTILGIAAGTLLLLVARRLLGQQGMLLTALLLLVYPFHLYMNTYILSETLMFFLTVLFFLTLFMYEGNEYGKAAVLFLLAFLMTFLRPEGAVLALVLGAIYLGKGVKVIFKSRQSKWVLGILAGLILAIAVVLAPRLLANYLPYNISWWIYNGSIPSSFAGQRIDIDYLGGSRYTGNILNQQMAKVDAAPDKATKNTLLLGYSWEFFKANPGEVIRKKYQQFRNAWTWCGYCEKRLLDRSDRIFTGLLLLGALGIFFSLALKDQKISLIAIIILLQNIVFTVFPTNARHRVPMMPLLFVLAVYSGILMFKFLKEVLASKGLTGSLDRFRPYRFSFSLAIIILSVIVIPVAWANTTDRPGHSQTSVQFYEPGWQVVQADDGMGEKTDDGWYGQLTSTAEILKKNLFLDADPAGIRQAKIAYFAAWNPNEPTGSRIRFTVNGRVAFTGETEKYALLGYNEVPIDPALLQKGVNEIWIQKDNGPGYIYILLDSDNYQQASWRSNDAGRTWLPSPRYGSKTPGELMIRLVYMKRNG